MPPDTSASSDTAREQYEAVLAMTPTLEALALLTTLVEQVHLTSILTGNGLLTRHFHVRITLTDRVTGTETGMITV